MTSCLIIDSSPVARMVARKILEGLGFEVDEAGDGRGGLDACRRRMPGAVLVDGDAPTLAGPEFLCQLRRLPGGAEAKVLLCSTATEPDPIRRALEAGADEYVMKPFAGDILQSKLALLGLP